MGASVFAHHEDGDGLWHVAEDGGTPEKLTTVDTAKGEFSHRLPHMLPGGEAVLFTIQKAPRSFDDAVVVARSLATGAQTVLIEGASDARYVPSGHLVLPANGRTTGAALRRGEARSHRRAHRCARRRMQDHQQHPAGRQLGRGASSVSSSGSLAYLAGGITAERIRSVVSIDRRGTPWSASRCAQAAISSRCCRPMTHRYSCAGVTSTTRRAARFRRWRASLGQAAVEERFGTRMAATHRFIRRHR